MRPSLSAFETLRRSRFRRRSNKRVVIQRKPLLVWVADGVSALARAVMTLGRKGMRPVAVVAFVVGVVVGGRWALLHVLDSPRFAVSQVLVGPTKSVNPDELIALANVAPGEKLLSVNPDEVASRVAAHPWVVAVHVERKLPSTLQIDVEERRAAAAAMLGGLYLVDDQGQPFKRAVTAEAAGLVILTGIDRAQYTENPAAVRAAYRSALALLEQYRYKRGRPPLSEIRVDPRFGFTLYFLESGAEVRLGTESHSEKLARLDQILDALAHAGLDAPKVMRIVHLDTSADNRVAMRLALGDS